MLPTTNTKEVPCVRKSAVVIIGAGLSGLCAAKLLTEKGIDVLVLEARERVGGRTHSILKDPAVGWVDLGGSYVGPTQNHILRLSRELGIQTYSVFSDFKSIHFSEGRAFSLSGSWPTFGWRSPLAWFDINFVVHEMEAMMKEIPCVDPWNCRHAQEWDGLTLQVFFEQKTWTKSGLSFLMAVARAEFACEPHEISLLWALWSIKCCGGVRRICSIDGGAQEKKFLTGAMSVSEKLHQLLKDGIHFGVKVCGLAQDKDGVSVTVANGHFTYRAGYVIMTAPLTMQLQIHYDPPLTAPRSMLIRSSKAGRAIKIIIYYKRPFWRYKGYSGQVTSGDGQLCFNEVLDDCHPKRPLAALTVFVVGDNALKLQKLPVEARMMQISRDLARVFQSDEAYHYAHYEEKNWFQDRYFGGGYASVFPAGATTKYGKVLRQPFYRVYFAGTETATSWPGTMNGAVQAGERAAREVLRDMKLIKEDEVWADEKEFKVRQILNQLIPTFVKPKRHN
ncbi:amine oxidase [flavin-containing] A-like [Ixodes scapularis]|uniref:amine oxidase [flavin-containing] A-like n=1 Tax=Ixodes scapularis TaxID=6945 RepID=UPI001A9FFD33|nr:amine oxidase [flavin-containing] A-like [Ixodes scapularis]